MTILEEKIHNFTNALQNALAQQNFFAALSLALTIPDICSKLEKPELYTKERYINWFNEFLLTKYQSEIGHDHILHTFLSGRDFYSLRCAFLHQGELDITGQKAREVLNDFVFIEPQVFGQVHMNQHNDTLQLQVDIFCVDVLLAIENWIQIHKSDAEINKRAASIIEIHKGYQF